MPMKSEHMKSHRQLIWKFHKQKAFIDFFFFKEKRKDQGEMKVDIPTMLAPQPLTSQKDPPPNIFIRSENAKQKAFIDWCRANLKSLNPSI